MNIEQVRIAEEQSKYKGIDYLRKKQRKIQNRVDLKFKYYDQKYVSLELNISTPPHLRGVKRVLGWCTQAVDRLHERITFDKISGNDLFQMNEIFDKNNKAILFDSLIKGALISACSFVYISTYEDGFPRLQAIDGRDATGVIDEVTQLLKEGYAIIERDAQDKIVREAYFTPEFTRIYYCGKLEGEYPNDTGVCLLVPIIYKPDARRPFGRSFIDRTKIDLVNEACRTIKRREIATEYNAVPQKYVLGMSTDAEFEKWKASMSAMLIIDSDADGNVPKVGQFAQIDTTPFDNELLSAARMFAFESGLTLADFNFEANNANTVEGNKSKHHAIDKMANKAKAYFANGILNVGYVASCVRNNTPFERVTDGLNPDDVTYKASYEADSTMMAGIGDAILKVNQAVPGYFGENNIEHLTGVKANGRY